MSTSILQSYAESEWKRIRKYQSIPEFRKYLEEKDKLAIGRHEPWKENGIQHHNRFSENEIGYSDHEYRKIYHSFEVKNRTSVLDDIKNLECLLYKSLNDKRILHARLEELQSLLKSDELTKQTLRLPASCGDTVICKDCKEKTELNEILETIKTGVHCTAVNVGTDQVTSIKENHRARNIFKMNLF
jgi:hypothetical protein